MKNNLFSLKRYLHLLHAEWVENWEARALYRFASPFLIVLLSTWFIFWVACMNFGTSTGEQSWDGIMKSLDGFLLSFWGAYALIMASQITTPLVRKKNRIRWLMTPGTALEKYLVLLKSWGVQVFILYPCIVVVSDTLRVAAFSVFYPSLSIPWGTFYHPVGIEGTHFFTSWTPVGWGALVAYFAVSVYVFGAMLWPKIAIVKTTLAVGALAALGTWFVVQVVTQCFPNGADGLAQIIRSIESSSPLLYSYIFNLWTLRIIILLAGLFFYVLAYFRLRETDLTNRW
jgi:hypothetical protein